MSNDHLTNFPEIWKGIPGWPGYEVSDQGRVRSYRVGGTKSKLVKEPRVLRPTLSVGYPSVSLCRDGKAFRTRIHVLVLLAFKGPCPPGMWAAHNDGTRTNNSLDNLRWDTLSNNQLDRRKHGTASVNVGESSPRAKLTDGKVLEIREMYAQGKHTHKMLAELFGVASPVITNIINGKYWKHLPFPPGSHDAYAKVKELHKTRPPKHFGANHPSAKLNNERVRTIRQLHSQGHSLASIGRMFGVTKQSIRAIVHHKTWTHIG